MNRKSTKPAEETTMIADVKTCSARLARKLLPLLLATAVMALTVPAQKKTLDPEPPQSDGGPNVPAPEAISSFINLPVTSTLPDPTIHESEVCGLYKGNMSDTVIFPLPYSVDANYEIGRDPLDISFANNTVTVGMHTYYWAEGTFSPLGIPIFGQCGSQSDVPVFGGDEETRELIATIDSRIDWHPDWHLKTTTTLRPFNNLNRCVVTVRRLHLTD